MAVKVLFMDFYGTLVREDDGLTREACRRIAERSPLNANAGDVGRVWWELMNQSYVACKGANYMELKEIQLAIIEELLDRFESHADMQELYTAIMQSWRQPQPYEEMRAFLSKLPIPLCVVANVDDDVFGQACKHVQVRFEHALTSQQARCYKPNMQIFTQALEYMDVAAEEALFVGDSLMYDIRPAMQAGLHTAWVNRNGRSHGDVQMDVMVNSLMKLKGLIR